MAASAKVNGDLLAINKDLNMVGKFVNLTPIMGIDRSNENAADRARLRESVRGNMGRALALMPVIQN